MRASRPVLRFLAAAAWLLGAAGAALIAAGVPVYFGAERPPFLVEKLPLPHEALWLFAVRVHVLTAVAALPLCLLLSLGVPARRWRGLHRWLGRLTGVLVLGGAVPSGFYLALFAKGGLPSTLGFWLSGVIAAVAMAAAITRARRGDLAGHRRAARHVLAQLSVAVTSRALLVAFAALEVDETAAYLVSLWLPVVGSALLVEVASLRAHNPLARTGRPRRSHVLAASQHEAGAGPADRRRLPSVGVAAG